MRHHAKHSSSRKNTGKAVIQDAFISKPIDGHQYLQVIEEQEYAERRPTAEEQRPRFSYLKNVQDK